MYKLLRLMRSQLTSQLPIVSHKEEIFQRLNSSNILILHGETGSGKSTQLPQLLCEYFRVFTNETVKPIVITQPRKIAACTLAQRIAFETNEEIHGFVDFAVNSGSRVNARSKIIVKLDKLLLDELERDPLLKGYSCLILDEAHQRTISIDVLIGFVHNILRQRKDFKVIITSATFETSLFEEYFNAETLKVSGRLHPVENLFIDYDEQISLEDRLYDCITKHILTSSFEMQAKYKGHVLVFCTGVDQINRLIERIRKLVSADKFLVLALHGKLSAEEQRLVFIESTGKHKLIFCTRIAQTSITIEKVTVVVDTGYDWENVYDREKQISSFKRNPITRSAAQQRAGRAGRTTHGFCFHLYSKSFLEGMIPQKSPEIENSSLNILVLRLKLLGVDDLLSFPYLTMPDKKELEGSIKRMKQIGCLTDKGGLTALGRAIVRIPMEPFLSRAIIEALLVRILDPSKDVVDKVITILAMMINNSSLFNDSEETRQQCSKQKLQRFADGRGDLFSFLTTYESFRTVNGNEGEAKFLRENYLRRKGLMQVKELIQEIKSILRNIYFTIESFDRSHILQIRQRIEEFPAEWDVIMGCLIPSCIESFGLYSGDSALGYNLVASGRRVNIYGPSFLSLQEIYPKWIVCFNIIETSRIYCRVAQQISFELMKMSISQEIFDTYGLHQYENRNPFYVNVELGLPSIMMKHIQIVRHLLPWPHKNNIPQSVSNNIILLRYPVKEEERKCKLISQINGFLSRKESEQFLYGYYGDSYVRLKDGCYVSDVYLRCCPALRVSVSPLNQKQYKTMKEYERYFSNPFQYSNDQLSVKFQSSYQERQIGHFNKMWAKLTTQYQELNDCKLDVSRENRRQYVSKNLKIEFQVIDSYFYIEYFKQESVADNNHSEQQHDANAKVLQNLCQILAAYFSNQITFKRAKGNLGVIARVRFPMSGVRDRNELHQRLRGFYQHYKGVPTHRTIAYVRCENIYLHDIGNITEMFDTITINCMVKFDFTCEEADCQVNEEGQCEIHPTVIRGTIPLLRNGSDGERFITKYDGKGSKLGFKWLKARVQYSQAIIAIPDFVFNKYKERYLKLKTLLKGRYPNTQITEVMADEHTPNYDMLKLVCSGSDRNHCVAASNQVLELFASFEFKLQRNLLQATDLDQQDRKTNEAILQRIEKQLQVCLDYNECLSEIRVYCKREMSKKVYRVMQQQLRSLLQTARISYRGRNVKKVRKIIHDFREKIKVKLTLSDKIVFAKGKCCDIADFEDHIQRLGGNRKGACPLCNGLLCLPFKLFKCGHSFCTSCIVAEMLFRAGQYEKLYECSEEAPHLLLLKCPIRDCSKRISIHDIKLLFENEENLQFILDRAVKSFINFSSRYCKCPTQDCLKLFDMEEATQTQCPMCGQAYCLQCRNYIHFGLTCEEDRLGLTLQEKNRLKREREELEILERERIEIQRQQQSRRQREERERIYRQSIHQEEMEKRRLERQRQWRLFQIVLATILSCAIILYFYRANSKK